jgi:hypothetical protein
MKPSDPPCDPSGDFEAWVIRTRLAQGLPARVEDPTVLARIADLIGIQQAADCQRTAATED